LIPKIPHRFLPAILALITIPAASQQTLNLIPYPSSVEQTPGYLPLAKDFHATTSRPEDPRLEGALTRALTRLDRQCGNIARPQNAPLAGRATLTLDVAAPGEAIQSLAEDETYSLTISASGAQIKAATDVGAMHALQTLLQLVTLHEGSCALPYVTITDTPRFAWRGYMLDVVRHFEPISEVKRTLNAMEFAKLNVFHWHLSDDEGFRAESKKYPKLTANASRGEFYTQDQLREIVAYARDRGIRVIPEFDMPGHSTSTVFAYPEYGSGEDIKFVPNVRGATRAALDPSNEKLYKFIDDFVGEMSAIFPDSYFHIGGDEVEDHNWLDNPRIVEYMKKKGYAKPADLQAYFNQRLLPILTKHHKKMVGWDEILSPALPKDIMIQSWRGEASLATGAQQGYQGILSAPYYLDAQKPSDMMYLADPIPADTKLTPDQQKLILGGEATMWAEQLHDETVDSRVWPRLLAISERFWSPQSRRDIPDMYRRLRIASLQLEDTGLQHISGPEALRRNLIASTHPGDTDTWVIDTFAAAIEPVSFGERSDTQKTDALQSLNRMVDAVVADPPLRQDFNDQVQTLLDPTSSVEARALAATHLREIFEQWQKASPELQTLALESPRLSDIGPRAHQLGDLADTGLEALTFLTAGTHPTPDWKAAKQAQITEAEKPSALIRFVFLPSLQKLIEATAN